MKSKVIIVANNKGGAGKTTTAAALGDIFARHLGKKVLLVDTDSQGNLSKYFGYGVGANIINTLEVYFQSAFEAEKKGEDCGFSVTTFFNEAILQKPTSLRKYTYDNLHIICSTRELEVIYERFISDTQTAFFVISNFINKLRELETYDYIIIDSSPTLSSNFGHFLYNSDYLLIPFPPHETAVDGAEGVINAFQIMNKRLKREKSGREIGLLGFFFCNFPKDGKRDKIYCQNKGNLWNESMFFDTIIPKQECVVHAENRNAPVTSVYPNKMASWKYIELAREVEDRIAKLEEGTLYD